MSVCILGIIYNTAICALMVVQWVKNLTSKAGDSGWIPMWGRAPGEGNGNLLQYSCLGYATERGAWLATVHAVTKESDRT